ncbi:MAG: hypothetical protein AB7E78_16185 [Porticoccaceae bacterium]
MAEENLHPETVDKTFKPLKDMIAVPATGRSPLWLSWHYLQVYATWGVRLPTTADDYKAQMGTSPVGYDFFPPMQDGSKLVVEACTGFLTKTYLDIVQLARDLLSYAGDVSPADGALFNVVMELLDANNTEDALTLLSDLQQKAADCETRAKAAGEALATFATQLTTATGKFSMARGALDRDSKTNEETLNKLSAADGAGSIAEYNRLIAEVRKDYDHNVVVSTTTLTYAWVIPVGLIAAAIVAGIFGDKAVKAMKRLEELEAQMKTAQSALVAANSSRNLYKMADQGLSSVMFYTQKAIENCDIVQQTWSGVRGDVESLKSWINRTTRTDANGVISPQSKTLLKVYLDHVGKAWQSMKPALKDLTTDNFITVAPGTTPAAAFAKEVEKVAAKAA